MGSAQFRYSHNLRDILDAKLVPLASTVNPALDELRAKRTRLRFALLGEFARSLANVSKANSLVINELCARLYWTSGILLQRNWGYLNGLLATYQVDNLMGFCSVLRSFVESAADTNYSMKIAMGGWLGNYRLLRLAVPAPRAAFPSALPRSRASDSLTQQVSLEQRGLYGVAGGRAGLPENHLSLIGSLVAFAGRDR